MGLMGTRAEPTALIGDQVFTDILGGNLLGVKTILVEPLSTQEFPTTRLIRRLERLGRTRGVQLGPRGQKPGSRRRVGAKSGIEPTRMRAHPTAGFSGPTARAAGQ